MLALTRGRRRALAGAAALALVITSCADNGTSEVDEDIAAEGGELLLWGWTGVYEDIAEAYMEENPEVTVEVQNVGTNEDQYTALQNAVAAGSGIPDLAQIEYYAIPQFAIADSLADLSELGAEDLEGTYTPGPWDSVTMEGGIWGLPIDSGPMAFFYNAALLEEHGIEVPETWEDFAQAARDLNEADPDVYLAADTGDAGFATSMIWQSGGRPYQVDGTSVSIDFSEPETQRWAELWNELIEDEVLAPITAWSDEWYQGMANGTIASLTTGAWMGSNLQSGVEEGHGDWRVAPMPQWEGEEFTTAENGGSSIAIMEDSDNKELAYDFLQFASNGGGADLARDQGVFPATVERLEDEDYLNEEVEYFGDQQVYQVLAESADSVAEGRQYLPFHVHAISIFNDTAGQAYVSDTTLSEGLEEWGEQSAAYGNEQGFDVE
ncbi:ABC transporter substrate-binding protein [Nesterenkonia alba]|uniref:ABC transporter substrate-binding protein n=1 Tax=Nesterenkonia alba TaxID=515814 RepID=UPI0003B45827|nr:sugar ABC transporter substrate-binding protein [Nesterenkonia alba]